MKKLFYGFLCLMLGWTGFSCNNGKTAQQVEEKDSTLTEVIHPDWTRNAVIYEVNLRQYTKEGTIKAFEAHLPRLKELGVDILWFMPIHPISEKNRKGELGSYYAVKDYKAVNPEFGTLEDFKAMIDNAHKAGFKVVIDWVPNHSGCDNAWVTEHPDWYVKNEEGKMYGPYDWTDVYKFDYSNKEMRAGMLDAMKFWVNLGVDGFRCDVAGEVPTDFWDETRPALDSIKPVFMLAEASKPELAKKAFDMSYNWPMKDLFNELTATQGINKRARADVKYDKNAESIDSLLAEQAVTYPGDTYMMNMITNHDLNSWEGTEYDRYGKGVDAFAVLTYTLPGMPLIYTGQEVGMDRAFEFFKKDTPPDWDAKNDCFEFYKKLNALKHGCTALKTGVEGAPLVRYATTNPDLYIFSRSDANGGVLVITNLSNDEAAIEYSGTAPVVKAVNYFSGVEEEIPASIEGWGYRVYTIK